MLFFNDLPGVEHFDLQIILFLFVPANHHRYFLFTPQHSVG